MKHSITAVLLIALATYTAAAAPGAETSPANKPLIGVNCDIDGDKPRLIGLSAPYVEALKKTGAIPVLLPPMQEADLLRVLQSLDAVMMIGGADYPPSLYGQKNDPKTEEMDEERWKFDILLARTVVEKTKLPLLGICAGCQALNISRGGSLVQDIPSRLPEKKVLHASKDGWQKGFNKHDVNFAKLAKLRAIYGIDKLSVPTSHHQCVDRTGDELQVAATADDGMTEAVELKGERFVMGVQWHPERDYDANKELFKNFVGAARVNAVVSGRTGSARGERASVQRRFTAE